MFTSDQYELLDFGSNRKLERFGSTILDRPAPAAESAQPANAQLWRSAAARFELHCVAKSSSARGQWAIRQSWQSIGTIVHGVVRLELKLTNFGHVGVFPEQAPNWDWLTQQICVSSAVNGIVNEQATTEKLRLLNLFAYTGGSTLSAAAAGAAVTHVDAAKNSVAWARRNAERSELSDAPIRWITDDAMKFVLREIKRGQRYDGVILDPPTYGHGARGESWKLDQNLLELLSMCRELTGPCPQLLLLTCHANQYDPQRLVDCLIGAGFTQRAAEIEAGDMWLTTNDGRRLNSGAFARIAKQQADTSYLMSSRS